jgi:hypothetical protein
MWMSILTVRCTSAIVFQVVADDPLSLHELKVSSKTGAQRQRQLKQQEKAARGAGRGAHLGPGVEEVEVDESQLQGVPVLWVQVSPRVGVLHPSIVLCRGWAEGFGWQWNMGV